MKQRYSKKLADSICRGLVQEKKISLICKELGIESPSLIYKWLNDKPKFMIAYKKAMLVKSEIMYFRTLDIINDQDIDNKEKIKLINLQSSLLDKYLKQNSCLQLTANNKESQVNIYLPFNNRN